MRDFLSSTLWRISNFQDALDSGVASTLSGEIGPALVNGTLLSVLRRLQSDPYDDCVLAALSVCIKYREPVLLFMAHGGWVWPVSVFPAARLFHSPRDLTELHDDVALSTLQLLGAARPEVRDPGSALAAERDPAALARWRPLSALIGALALHGPRSTLLEEITGRAAYRLAPGRADDLPPAPGALQPALQRLRRDAAALSDIARWPGMSLDRACRLLNALYLSGALMITRSHPAAREAPAGAHSRPPRTR